MSDRPELAMMGEQELRAWLEKLPAQELVEIVVSYVRAFLRDGVDDYGAGGGALGELLEMNFAQIVSYLKENTRLPELSRMRVEGDVVKYQTAAGSDIILNATGLQDGPAIPGFAPRASTGPARSTPDPTRGSGRPRPPARDQEPRNDAGPGSTPPRRIGGLFGGGGTGTGEARAGRPEPRARQTGRPPTAPAGRGPQRPKEPPKVKPEKAEPQKKNRFSLLEFD